MLCALFRLFLPSRSGKIRGGKSAGAPFLSGKEKHLIMKRIAPALNLLLGSLLTFLILFQLSFRDKAAQEAKNPARGAQWTPPKLPEALSFAGEAVPLERWDVREKFDREYLLNYYAPGNVLLLLKLANRNFPLISERLKANGVPDDFKYLCIAESNMQSWALSKAGAVGYWQFMPETAPGYGMEVNSEVDQRQDLEKSTDAACRYLKQAYTRFGSWTAAAASYNCGQGGYGSQAGFQQTSNYYDLHLPEETNKYIYRILTFKYLMENAAALGYVVDEQDKYPAIPVRVLKVDTSIPNLASFARANGTTYKILRLLNPWLRGRSLTVRGGKAYEIRLPAGSATAGRQ